jgi:hypothetical protein
VADQKAFVPLLGDDKQAVRLRAAAAYLRLQMIRERPAAKPRSPAPAPAQPPPLK